MKTTCTECRTTEKFLTRNTATENGWRVGSVTAHGPEPSDQYASGICPDCS